MKLCKDCKHFREQPSFPPLCVRRGEQTDPVYGHVTAIDAWTCKTERQWSMTNCGTEGRYWEPKE